VIEDACQAHGAEFDGRKVGAFGTGCFSFYATKNMTTGEGGIITTNDDQVRIDNVYQHRYGSSVIFQQPFYCSRSMFIRSCHMQL